MNVFKILKDSISFLPENFLEIHKRLFIDEHLLRLASHLEDYAQNGIPVDPIPPSLPEETTPSLFNAFEIFKPLLQEYKKTNDYDKHKWAEGINTCNCAGLLLLLGQRRTPASLIDYQGIPPSRNILILSACEIYKEGLTHLGRAWDKHARRSKETFWKVPKGGEAQKNKDSLDVLNYLLDHYTWSNIFGHFQHESVYEIRVPAGYGARWKGNGKEFIGFLDPFTNEKNEFGT